MSEDEMIKVLTAHKSGSLIQRRVATPRLRNEEGWGNPRYPIQNWDFSQYEYRVAPEPCKPREWVINVKSGGKFPDPESQVIGGCEYGKICGIPGNAEQVHVREVIE